MTPSTGTAQLPYAIAQERAHNGVPVSSARLIDADDDFSEQDEIVESKNFGTSAVDVVPFAAHQIPTDLISTTPTDIVQNNNSVVVKPVAMKVLRPIPKRMSEQFYNEAFQDGLTLQETNQAAMMAHEWHRRWTQQEEVNHTTPHEDFYQAGSSPGSSQEIVFPSHYAAALELDRQGAKNPSLGDSLSALSASPGSDEHMKSDEVVLEFEERVKRTRQLLDATAEVLDVELNEIIEFQPQDHFATSVTDTISSSLSSYMAPHVKRRFMGAVVAEDEDEHDEFPPAQPLPIRPLAVRPTAMRPINFPETQQHQPHITGVPQDITALREASVSPMSCSPESSSLSSSVGFHHPEGLMTLLPQEDNVVHVVEDEPLLETLTQPIPPSSEVEKARDDILRSLAVTKGDVDSEDFKKAVDPLEKYFTKEELESRCQAVGSDGMWLTLSKPTFFGCLGENDNGDPMYTLGRMSFDMFSPTNLVCSLQGNFNPVEIVSKEDRKSMLEAVPKSLREEVENGKTVLRTYHIVTAFTIEPTLASFPDAPNKDVSRPIKGIMTTYGYSLPDPKTANRHSIWFTGGRIEPNNDAVDIAAWNKLFSIHPPKHSFSEKAKLLAVKLLMGATVPEKIASDGSMEYAFTRPLGGHGMAYINVIYLDDSMRIVRGHRGTTFVFSRVHDQ